MDTQMIEKEIKIMLLGDLPKTAGDATYNRIFPRNYDYILPIGYVDYSQTVEK